MTDKQKSSNFWSYALTALVFFITGAGGVLAYNNFFVKNFFVKKEKPTEIEINQNQRESEPKEDIMPSTQKWEEITAAGPQSPATNNNSSSKFTILESKKIYADKASLETGETVNFFATLKNIGTKKKFLTHACFNHSGGVTFGCQLNINIGPGEEFPIHNSMIFTSPGNYSVWLTWSQDKTNFYRPSGAGSTSVQIQ